MICFGGRSDVFIPCLGGAGGVGEYEGESEWRGEQALARVDSLSH
jgi:hypothetical protein